MKKFTLIVVVFGLLGSGSIHVLNATLNCQQLSDYSDQM